jgi:hypothetical protein
MRGVVMIRKSINIKPGTVDDVLAVSYASQGRKVYSIGVKGGGVGGEAR